MLVDALTLQRLSTRNNPRRDRKTFGRVSDLRGDKRPANGNLGVKVLINKVKLNKSRITQVVRTGELIVTVS